MKILVLKDNEEDIQLETKKWAYVNVKKCQQVILKLLLCFFFFFFTLLLGRLWENWVYLQCSLSILLLPSVVAATLRLLPTTMICRLWINSIKQNKESFCSHGAYKSVLRHRKLIYNMIIIQCVRQWSGTYIKSSFFS